MNARDGEETTGAASAVVSAGEAEPPEVEVRRLREELRRARELHRTIADSARDMIFVVGSDLRVRYVNAVAARARGLPAEAMVDRRVEELFPAETAERQTASLRRVLDTGQPFEVEAPSRFGDRLVWLDSWLVPLRGEDGTVEGVAGFSRDVTERRRLEAEVQRTQRIEALGLLAGGIAHDFNNLLAALLGNISLAALDPGLPATTQERLAEATHAARRARDLTRQLLAFAKGGAPARKVVDTRALLREVTSFVLRGTRQHCRLDLAEDLWSLEADEGQVTQALGNLLLNAVQAMPRGGEVAVAAGNHRGPPPGAAAPPDAIFVRIAVRDHGPGIPAEVLPRIFDPYFTTKPQGTGLGLTTAHTIARKHDGTLTVDAPPDGGAEFTLYLPATTARPAPAPDSSPPRARREARILVMDDEPAVREVCARMLQRQGYAVDTVEDGAAAVEAFRTARQAGRPYAALIMDLTVRGGMGGREALGRILAMEPRARALVSSGYSEDPVMADPAAYGFRGVIPKPYQLSELEAAVAAVLADPD